MFEFIGIAVVCWFAFKIVMAFVKAKGTVSSKEYGLETRRIATQELLVPSSYYNFLTTNHMESVKETAIMIREKDECKNTSWPRLMALAIYAFFYLDCNEVIKGDFDKTTLFSKLKIEPEITVEIAMQNPTEIRTKYS